MYLGDPWYYSVVTTSAAMQEQGRCSCSMEVAVAFQKVWSMGYGKEIVKFFF
jgi:hypothetical protein